MRDVSYRVALGGIVSALCLISMFIAGIVPALYLLLPMASGVLLMIIASEVSIQWAFLTYISVSILSLFITADKEASLVFIMLFGHYPIIRFYVQKIKISLLRFIVKFVIFNFCAISFFFVTVYLFGVEQMLDSMEEIGKYGKPVMLCAVNIIFVLYDLNLQAIYEIYRHRFMKRLKRKK